LFQPSLASAVGISPSPALTATTIFVLLFSRIFRRYALSSFVPIRALAQQANQLLAETDDKTSSVDILKCFFR
jgi:hypothetical protein